VSKAPEIAAPEAQPDERIRVHASSDSEANGSEAPTTRAGSEISGRPRRRPLRVLEAQRWLDLISMRLAPAGAAGLIAYSHLGSPGEGLVVFASVLAASQLLTDRAHLPLNLIPGARIALGLAGPVLGGAFAWLTATAVGGDYPASQFEVVVLGAWVVLAVGAWLRSKLEAGMVARVAVIGPRDFAADLAAELAANEVGIYEVVGWIGPEGPADYRRMRWLGEIDDVRQAVLTQRIELLVCAPMAGDAAGEGFDSTHARVAESCLDLPVRLIGANQLYEETLGHVPIGTIDAAWYRYIMHPRFRASSPLSKRIFDLVVATVIAVISLPVLIAAAVAIKLGDWGPVFYRQRRLGEHGEGFEIVKLRTMRVDAEAEGPQWSEADDARVTRVGRVLRRTHLDELPQLWNVFRGDMTLVGPRPERPEIVVELESRFSHYTRRQLVKPGITGWAQLRCGYAGSELGTAWKLSHDLFYVKRRSTLADALIVGETAVVAFRDAHRRMRAPDERFLIGRSVHDG
jgi:exopolysaccharide biosynthesis polyprenyl glycosylphosphotransferase